MWAVPRDHECGTVAVLASGPSMSAEVAECVRAADVPAIAINSTIKLAPWAWALYAADIEWWLHPSNAEAVAAFRGHRISVSAVRGVHQLQNTGIEGIDFTPGCIRTGGNSGYQALQVAVHSGARRVLLCGFDMRPVCHWHGPHPHGLRSTPPATYAIWAGRFASAAPLLAGAGIEVINCSSDSALSCFPVMTIDEALEQIA